MRALMVAEVMQRDTVGLRKLSCHCLGLGLKVPNICLWGGKIQWEGEKTGMLWKTGGGSAGSAEDE